MNALFWIPKEEQAVPPEAVDKVSDDVLLWLGCWCACMYYVGGLVYMGVRIRAEGGRALLTRGYIYVSNLPHKTTGGDQAPAALHRGPLPVRHLAAARIARPGRECTCLFVLYMYMCTCVDGIRA